MKLLYILNVANRVNNFCMSSLLAAKELGIEYHVAGNWGYEDDVQRQADEQKYGIRIHQIDFIRSPVDPRNYKAYRQLQALALAENFDAIHCNTPIGGLLGRIVFRKMPGVKIIYQAHGFHFCMDTPKFNWLIYYPIEKWLARHTDGLITINHEDYGLASERFTLRNGGRVYYVPGVGMDIAQSSTDNALRQSKRQELNLGEQDIALISMGDLILRKNYDSAIRAIAATKNSNLHYFICGKGPEENKLKKLSNDLNVSNRIHFLGYRTDIKQLLCASDIFLFTTKQEGLPRSMMEAMAAGLPCVASAIRGNTDLLEDGKGGFLCQTTDAADYAKKITQLANDSNLREQMGAYNQCAIESFSMDTVIKKIVEVYSNEFFCGTI